MDEILGSGVSAVGGTMFAVGMLFVAPVHWRWLHWRSAHRVAHDMVANAWLKPYDWHAITAERMYTWRDWNFVSWGTVVLGDWLWNPGGILLFLLKFTMSVIVGFNLTAVWASTRCDMYKTVRQRFRAWRAARKAKAATVPA